MTLAEALRHQGLDGLPEQLGTLVAEQRLRLLVEQHDSPVLAHPDDGVRRELEELLELELGSLALACVPDHARVDAPTIALPAAQRELERELFTRAPKA